MISSYELRDKLGSQFHWEWFELVPWDRRHEIEFSLAAAGVHHLRMMCFPDDPTKSTATRDHPVHTWIEELAGNGFKFLFSIGEPWHGMLDHSVAASDWFGPLDASIDTIARRYRDVCVGLEMPNEYDNVGAYTSPNIILPWDANLKEFINRAGFMWQGNPVLNHLPIVGPSFVHDTSAQVIGDMSYVLDANNAHPYWGSPYPQSRVVAERAKYDAMLPGSSPLWATEFNTPVPPQSQINQRRLALIEFLALVLGGVERAYIYAWVDTQQGLGVLNNDLTPRSLYDGIQKTMGMCDTVPCTPAPFAYQVTGQTNLARWFPVGNADGSHTLYFFREAPFGSSPQTLHLSVPAAQHMVSTDLITGGQDCPKDQPNGISQDIVLGDDPFAVRIS